MSIQKKDQVDWAVEYILYRYDSFQNYDEKHKNIPSY